MADDSQLKPRGQYGIPTDRDLVGTIKGRGPKITTRINIVEGGAAIVLIGGQGIARPVTVVSAAVFEARQCIADLKVQSAYTAERFRQISDQFGLQSIVNRTPYRPKKWQWRSIWIDARESARIPK